MFNLALIKRSLAVGLTAAAAAFPAAAQAAQIMDSGGVQAATQVPATEPQLDRQAGIDRLQSNVQQWFATHGHFVSPSSSPTTATASSGNGFDWGDAGIGAAGMVALLGAGALGTTVTRRRRSPALN
jgi:hypothetical protein